MVKLVVILWICLTMYTSILLYFGVANLWSTISLYLTLFLVPYFLLNKLSKKISLLRNVLFGYTILLASLFFLEMGVKYVLKYNLTYNELEGGWYNSIYKYDRKMNLASKLPGFSKVHSGIFMGTQNTSVERSCTEFNYTHKYNYLGFRAASHNNLNIDPSLKTIVTLGDSFTEGLGASSDSTWPELLSGIINSYNGQNYTVINAAYQGSDPVAEFYKLKHYILKISTPDIVILGVNLSDIQDVMIRGGQERFLEDGIIQFSKAPWWENIYATSFIARAIIHSFLGYDQMLMTKSMNELKLQQSQSIINSTLENYSELCSLRNIKFVVVFIPFPNEITSRTSDLSPCIQVAKLLPNTETIVLMDSISDEQIKQMYWPIDGHATGYGNQVFAQNISRNLIFSKCIQTNNN